MNNIERFTTLKLEFSRVAWYLGNLLSALLGRQISCTAKAEDDSYWSIAAIDDRFTNSEVVSLIRYVGGDSTMIRRCLPPDSNSSRSLDMDLCEALLKHVLKMDWKLEFVTEDALWILGNWPEPMQLPEADENLIFIDSRVIDCTKLMPMKEFVEKLFDDGGTFTALTNLCEDNEVDFGTPLYWMHPYTDGLYNGCYFVLVREGVMVLSYDAIDWEDHEVFNRESVRLCDADEMRSFYWEYKKRTSEMLDLIQPIDCGDNSALHTVRDWLSGFNIQLEDQAFVRWHQEIAKIGNILIQAEKKLSAPVMGKIWDTVLILLYLNYDVTKDYLQQFEENAEDLMTALHTVQTMMKGF